MAASSTWLQRIRILWQVFVIVVVTTTTAPTAGRRDDLIVNTEKGRVRGVRYYLPDFGKAVEAYLGIPFAQPPVGHLRYRHPQPCEKWSGVFNATKLPNSCYQTPDHFFGDFHGSTMWNSATKVSEDCLYVNVWVPKTNPRIRKSAVLVWIYGGGFYSGTVTLNLYDGKIMAALNDIIVVSINYRVGALGFMNLGHPGAPGNAGMFDQVMGLEWVQQNIAYFGGDPNNVTLFGESAGSVSVSLHLFSPLSRSKFHRAIMQSGVANMPWGTCTMAESKRRSLEVAFGDYLSCPATDNMDKVIECLRGIAPQTLVENQWMSRGVMQFPFLPVVDGAFLLESPQVSLERGSFKKCPVLLGSNGNEGSWFIIYELPELLTLNSVSMTYEEFVSSVSHLFFYYPQYPTMITPLGLDAIRHQYTNWLDTDDEEAHVQALSYAVGDCHFVCHVNEFANIYARAGENVYTYFFTQRYSQNPWPHWMGVLHGDDIMFMFGEGFKRGSNYTSEEKQLSRKMMTYWTNFAKTGDPNRAPGQHSLNEWPLHTPKGREYLELNTKHLHQADKSKAVGSGPRIRECAFWKEYLPDLVNQTRNISEVEREWKHQFHEWSTKYIVDWKIQFDRFQRTMDECPGDGGT